MKAAPPASRPADVTAPPYPTARFRLSCDTGGTFTDLVIEDDRQSIWMFKAATVPSDPTKGVLDAIAKAAEAFALPVAELLGRTDMVIHGTTHAINAVITGNTARTALLTTKGHRDILTLREGGRYDPFDHTTPFPSPYIPRHLTFEIGGRIDWAGNVLQPLDDADVLSVIEQMRAADVAAVAVCLLWSISNDAHERRIGALLAEHLPGVAITLSSALNPSLREYRRASSAVIDVSLKPLMGRYLGQLEERLRAAGLGTRLMVVTSQGGMVDAAELATTPIKAINSGPAMAPVAGRYFIGATHPGRDIIVADTGGTTYDVSLVRDAAIPFTREAWIGRPFSGHMTGFPSVDVKSVGAGGGSIAWVDSGGMLHVGPRSAGAVPGPVCYGRGGTEPTVTDAAVVLGYVDPDYFLGGTVKLDAAAAREAIRSAVAVPLGGSIEEAAASIIEVATENMVQAIDEITVDQGVDPAQAVLLGGGGAAGLNSIFIARRLGCSTLVIPELGATLSAAGGLLSDISGDFRKACFLASDRFDALQAEALIAELRADAEAFFRKAGGGEDDGSIAFAVEARYPRQAWEIEVPLDTGPFDGESLAKLVQRFHASHQRIYAVNDEASPIEIVGITAKASLPARTTRLGVLSSLSDMPGDRPTRRVFFAREGARDVPVHRTERLAANMSIEGPAIIESPFTSVVVDTQSQFRITDDHVLIIDLTYTAA